MDTLPSDLQHITGLQPRGHDGAALGKLPKCKPEPLPAEEQDRLAALAQAGDLNARNALWVVSLGLVRRFAFSMPRGRPGIDVNDLIGEGNFALVDAIRCYRPGRGAKFSSYASDCIIRRINRYANSRNARPLPREPGGADLEQTADVIDADYLSRSAVLAERWRRLTPDQCEVVDMRAAGKSLKAIAAETGRTLAEVRALSDGARKILLAEGGAVEVAKAA